MWSALMFIGVGLVDAEVRAEAADKADYDLSWWIYIIILHEHPNEPR